MSKSEMEYADRFEQEDRREAEALQAKFDLLEDNDDKKILTFQQIVGPRYWRVITIEEEIAGRYKSRVIQLETPYQDDKNQPVKRYYLPMFSGKNMDKLLSGLQE